MCVCMYVLLLSASRICLAWLSQSPRISTCRLQLQAQVLTDMIATFSSRPSTVAADPLARPLLKCPHTCDDSWIRSGSKSGTDWTRDFSPLVTPKSTWQARASVANCISKSKELSQPHSSVIAICVADTGRRPLPLQLCGCNPLTRLVSPRARNT